MEIPYDESKKERDRITAEREKKLYQSFENMRKQIDEQIQTMNFSTVSEKVKRQQLEEIRHELQKQLQGHYNALEAGLKDDMVEVGESVLKESESFYADLNMPIGMSITSFPVEVMNNIVNGSVYDEKWYLSRALWGDYTEKLDQINEVLTQGVGLNLSSLEIAKQLEQYVDPKAMTPSKTIVTPCLQDPVTGKLYSMDYVRRHPEKDWTGFTEKNSYFRYGKVDYNAQRLARTLINHAYQQNVVHQAKANPFAKGVKWLASGGERMCEICEERDGKIYSPDDIPLDHPNGMCTFEVVTDLSMMEMSDVLAAWVNGESTDYDDALYAWYNDRTEVPIERAKELFNINYAKSISDVNLCLDQNGWFRDGWKSDLSGIDVETAKEIYGVYSRIFDKIPWLKGKIDGPIVGDTISGAYASCKTNSGGRMKLDASWFSNIEKLKSKYNKDVRLGFHPEGTNAYSIITHEIGHAVDGYLTSAGIFGDGQASSYILDMVLNEDGIYGEESYSKSSIGRLISSYASRNEREFFAEGFAMYVDSNADQNGMIRKFSDVMEDINGRML